MGSWLPIGRPDARTIAYISRHRERYKGFTDWKRIQQIEKRLSVRPRFWIPEAELGAWLPLLRDGDIIAFIPSDSLLDVSHVGVFFGRGTRPPLRMLLSRRTSGSGAKTSVLIWTAGEKVIGITVFRPFGQL